MKNKVFEVNPWDEIFSHGIPQDLIDPYPGLFYILQYAKECGITSGMALDVAMGAGRHSYIHNEKGYTVSGFDLSKNALDLVEVESEKKEIIITTSQANMFEQFPYQDNIFDVSIAIQAIYHGHKNDMLHAMKEMHRTAKSGAVIGITFSKNHIRSTTGSNDPQVREVEPRTYLPTSGREKGLLHFYPSESEINSMTQDLFEDITYLEDNEYQYKVLLGRNK